MLALCGEPRADPLDIHHAILDGIPARDAAAILAACALPKSELLAAWGISSRSFNRAIAGDLRLNHGASEQVVRLAEVVAVVTDLFGTPQVASHWLMSPVLALGLRRPIDLVRTAIGTEYLLDLLGAINHGVYR